jgi:hypothetical protein
VHGICPIRYSCCMVRWWRPCTHLSADNIRTIAEMNMRSTIILQCESWWRARLPYAERVAPMLLQFVLQMALDPAASVSCV